MRERGKYQIQLMKTRSSSGVGMKIDLEFDVDTLRITDAGEDGQGDGDYRPKSSAILDTIKRTTTSSQVDPETGEVDPSAGAPLPKIRAQTDSTKLRQFLSGLSDPSSDTI